MLTADGRHFAAGLVVGLYPGPHWGLTTFADDEKRRDLFRRMSDAGCNYLRVLASAGAYYPGQGWIHPYRRRGGKFDLDEWNPVYWGLWDRIMEDAAKRKILFQVAFIEGAGMRLWDEPTAPEVAPFHERYGRLHNYFSARQSHQGEPGGFRRANDFYASPIARRHCRRLIRTFMQRYAGYEFLVEIGNELQRDEPSYPGFETEMIAAVGRGRVIFPRDAWDHGDLAHRIPGREGFSPGKAAELSRKLRRRFGPKLIVHDDDCCATSSCWQDKTLAATVAICSGAAGVSLMGFDERRMSTRLEQTIEALGRLRRFVNRFFALPGTAPVAPSDMDAEDVYAVADPSRERWLIAAPYGGRIRLPEPASWVGMNPLTGETWEAEGAQMDFSQPCIAAAKRAERDTSPCTPSRTKLCLQDRFEVSARWRIVADGREGDAVARPDTKSTGSFYFFSVDNVELYVKILPGPDYWWVFVAPLTDEGFDLKIRDTATGQVRRYAQPGRDPQVVIDFRAFRA